MQQKLKTIIALSIIPQIILVKVLANFPEQIERYYSNGLYPLLSKLFRYILGWIPFSFGDILYAIGIILILRHFIINGKQLFTKTFSFLRDILMVLSMVYFAFHILWGMNYYRLPLHTSLKIENDYTTQELIDFTELLIAKTNATHLEITKQDSIAVVVPYTIKQVFDKTPEGYKKLSEEYPHLAYYPKSIKTSLFSYPLTYMGFSGYLNPFTHEGHVDYLIPAHKFPTTSSHEEAHQLGYSAENEANFLGYLASINNDDIYFKYSGYTFGLKHCINEIGRRSPEQGETLLNKINPGVLKNYEEARLFWEDHQNIFEPIFKGTFNTFLKANSQQDGIQSYNYVVALLVNYYKDRPLK